MKRIIFAILIVALAASVSSGFYRGRSHTSFTEVFVNDAGGFYKFAIANTGDNQLWVRFAYVGSAIGDLTTDSIPVPAGASWTPANNGDLGRAALAYWLSAATATTAVTSFSE